MRKAFTLIEVLVVLVVISIISIPLARLSTITLRDIPESYRMIGSNTSVLNALKRIHKDINLAKGFPRSFESYSANNENLLIELPTGVICYQLKEQKIIRRTLSITPPGGDHESTSWPVPKAEIKWQVWRRNGTGYAVEVKTSILRKRGKHLDKKMANSHLYFAGSYQEAIN